MAAGLGFKTFNTGDVLSATDVNGYLMQGVLVFASTAARDAAITSPQEGQFAFTKDTDQLWYRSASAWVASGATGDIEGVTAGTGITGGGTSGTVTITNDMATTITAAGDIVVGTGSGTYDNLPIGTTAQILTADTTVSPYKVKWATPSGSTLSLSLIASGSLSGSSLTLSSLSSYDTLILMIYNVNLSTDSQLRLRVNGDSTDNYWAFGFTQTGSTSERVVDAGDNGWKTADNMVAGANGNELIWQLQNCKAAGFTSGGWAGSYNSTRRGEMALSGVYAVAEAVSSLVLAPLGGTYSGGNYRLYGG